MRRWASSCAPTLALLLPTGLAHTYSRACVARCQGGGKHTCPPSHATYLTTHTYIVQVDAIVYLVDAADRERFPESYRELAGLLSDDGLSGVPFLVLGNKIDLPYAGMCLLVCRSACMMLV